MKKLFIIGSLLLLGLYSVQAQGTRDIRINEVLVFNEDGYADDFAHKVSWIELFNAGYSSANVGGCYLTVKVGDETRTYRIPKNDPRMNIPSQSYVIFYADGTPTNGNFHTNFRLDDTGYLALMDQSGRNIISEINYDIPAQERDVSIGWYLQDEAQVFGKLPKLTPLASNEIVEPIPQYEIYNRRDPSGIIMTVTAMSVVFSALVLLYLAFKLVGKTMIRRDKRKENAKNPKPETVGSALVANDDDLDGEQIAAIAMAMQQYEDDLHDIESAVITINRVARAYSPWSSKIYGLRQLPTKK